MTVDDLYRQDFGLISNLIAAHAAERPGAAAVVDGESVTTYGDFDVLIDRVAYGLQRSHVAAGQAIAICAASSMEYLAVFIGALRAGIAVSPLSPSSSPEQLLMMLDDCAAALLFLDGPAADLVEPVARQIQARRIVLRGSAAGEAFDEWLPPDAAKPAPVAILPEWPFNIIYSSGTTGTPKGIVQSHAFRWAMIPSAGQAFQFSAGTVTIASTPLYSNTTLGCVLGTLAYGGKLVLMRKFDTQSFLELSQGHGATHAMLVPIQYQRLMTTPAFDQFDLSSFIMKFCTSAPFSADLKAEVLRRWPGGLVEFYGMTEGGGSFVLLAHDHPDKLHTVGRPTPDCDVRIIDEQGVELPAGGVGEVVGRSSAMMSGYHNQPQKTADAEWISSSGECFIRTGDIGRFDEDGFLVLMDRKKDMIISGGFNIYPSDIEAVISQHPAVLEAAVVGVSSDAWGETPVAFVTPRADALLDVVELAAFVSGRLGKTQRPQAYEIIASLPRSAIGKVLKRELREGFTGRVA